MRECLLDVQENKKFNVLRIIPYVRVIRVVAILNILINVLMDNARKIFRNVSIKIITVVIHSWIDVEMGFVEKIVKKFKLLVVDLKVQYVALMGDVLKMKFFVFLSSVTLKNLLNVQMVHVKNHFKNVNTIHNL